MCDMSLHETSLPGIGVRRELDLADGRRIGVVTHRDAQTELILSDAEDPDACAACLPLTLEEASALGALLSGPRLVSQPQEEHADLPGITTRQLILPSDSPYAGEVLGATRTRTRTGVSIVAVALVAAATKVARGYLAARGGDRRAAGDDCVRDGLCARPGGRRAGAHAVRGRVRSLARPGDDAGPVHRPGWCMVVPAPQADAERLRGRSSMVERLLPKQDTRVRFPSPAPHHDDGPGPLTRGTRGRRHAAPPR